MRKINCRNVRREIEEAAPGASLSSTSNEHLMSCVACETLAREQSKLQQIVSSLGTVEAPGDFDFRLRARLAAEKRYGARNFTPFAIGPVSFGFGSVGLRSAAVAVLLLLLGSAFVFVSLRSQSNNSFSAKAPANGPAPNGEQSVQPANVAKAGDAADATSNPNGHQANVTVAGARSPNSGANPPAKRRSAPRQMEEVALKDRVGVRDQSSTQAPVLTRYDETYPTTAFPIDASYQSLKVSVDNGRGTSRTISLPSVSFGSKQSLSQNGSPLMASAREAW